MTVILTILTVEPLSIMLKLSGWGLCLVLETSCGACVYYVGVIRMTVILTILTMEPAEVIRMELAYYVKSYFLD